MINFGEVPAGAVLPIPFAAYAAATGASVTLTGLAVTDIEVYKGVSMTQRSSDAGYALMDTDGIDLDGITGIHGFSIDTGDNSDASFYAVGSFFTVVVSAVTIDGQTVNFIAATFRLRAAESAAGVPKADVSHFGGAAGTFASGRAEVNTTHAAGTAWNSGAIGASTLAADTITAAKVAADVTTELQTGLATASALATVAGYIDTEIADIQSRLPAALVGGRMSSDMVAISGDTTAADNLETAFDDTAGAVPWQGIVDQGTAQAATSTTLQLRSAVSFANDEILGAVIVITGGSAGVGQARTITDYVNSTDTATVDAWTTTPTGTITYKILAAPPADATAAAIKIVTDKLDDVLEDSGGGAWIFTTAALANGPSGSGPSAATIADAVWDEALSGHAVSGSTGEALSAAGASGDPWITSLPGSYSAGQAGYIVGTNINATVSSRAAASVLGAAVGASISADIAAVKTDAAAVKLKTDNLPSDPADASDIAASFSTVNGTLATIAAYVDTEVGAIYTRLGAPDGASIAADIAAAKAQTAAIETDTQDIQSRLPAALSNGKMDSTNSDTVVLATVGTGSTTTSIVTSAFSPAGGVADQFKGRIVIFDNDTATAALRGQASDITASTNSATPVLTVTALTTAPSSGDTFTVV